MEGNAAQEYARRFARLQTNKNRKHWTGLTNNQAPHKPLLLLSVLDLFEQGVIATNFIELTPELSETFDGYWMRVFPLDRRGNLTLPFFHLRSDGFWKLLPRPGKEEVLKAVSSLSSVPQLQEVVVGASLENPLYELLRSQRPRDLLRSTLIEAYFAPEIRSMLVEQSAVNQEAFVYGKKLLERDAGQFVREALEEDTAYRPAARDRGFRRAVVVAYAHRCALCGIRVRTLSGHTAVDAAHIIPWSADRDDRPANGLALCRTCHWAFDEGLIGVSRAYEVIASGQLRAANNLPGYLGGLEGEAITRPKDETYWPDHRSLQWHREHVFTPAQR